MTIYSDDELMRSKVTGGGKQKSIVPQDDEEILISNNVMSKETKKLAIVGSWQMWKFSESVVLGKHAQSYVDQEEKATKADERAPLKIPIEKRVKLDR